MHSRNAKLIIHFSLFSYFCAQIAKGGKNENRSGWGYRTGRLEDASSA
jgi:hypothetical protein